MGVPDNSQEHLQRRRLSLRSLLTVVTGFAVSTGMVGIGLGQQSDLIFAIGSLMLGFTMLVSAEYIAFLTQRRAALHFIYGIAIFAVLFLLLFWMIVPRIR